MKRFILLSLLLMAVFVPDLVQGQCAMCKAVVESNAQTGDNIVEGVNHAILYLMGVPYFLVFGLGYFWYKKFWKSDREEV